MTRYHTEQLEMTFHLATPTRESLGFMFRDLAAVAFDGLARVVLAPRALKLLLAVREDEDHDALAERVVEALRPYIVGEPGSRWVPRAKDGG